jgi:hypothetical protein
MKIYLRTLVLFACLLSLAACTMSAPEQQEEEVMSLSTMGELGERGFTTPTGWWWLSNATPAQITSKVNEGYRLFDIEVNSNEPRFAAVFVKNSGIHAKSWWWYYGQTDAQVADRIGQHNARIIDREIYYVNGQKRNAIVMIPNGGKTWWYYSGLSFADIGDRLAANAPARLLDLDSYVVNGTRYYSIVMIRNSGVDAKTWWYYAGVTTTQISNFLSQNNARLTDLERRDDGKYTVVMERLQGESWWWYYGQTESSVNDLTSQKGARIIDIERYSTASGIRYNVVMLDNLNAQSRRMASVLGQNQTGGNYGLYVKQVNGNVQAELQKDFTFEPASTIKALHHVHAMRQVALGNIALTTDVPWFTVSSNNVSPKDGCPSDLGAAVDDLQVGLEAMMETSDNRWTQAMRVRFGEANLNTTAGALGMSDTLLQHRIGCAGGADGAIAEPNQLTLVDIGKLYEAVASDYLLSNANRDTFYSLMSNGLSSDLTSVIDQEAAALGLSNSAIDSFKGGVDTAAKAGKYGLNGKTYTSIGGWIKLPFQSGGRTTYKEYVFGVFFHEADSVTGNVWTYRAELLREQIRAALETF